MQNIVVTGAGGFSGAELVHYLHSKGHNVTAVIRSGLGRLAGSAFSSRNLKVVQADLSMPIDLPHTADAIFHIAARSPSAGVSVDSMVRDNVLATRNLLAYAKATDVKLFVFFSSLSVHGEVVEEVLDEETPIRNPSPYGLTKLICEEILRGESMSMRSLAIRLPGVIGRKSMRNWLSRSLVAAYAGEDIKAFNADAPFNNAVHVADLCNFSGGLLKKVWEGFDVVTLGAAGQLPVGTVAKLIAEAGARGSRVIIENAGKTSYRISSVRAQAQYSYSPMNIEAMLKQFILENSDLSDTEGAIRGGVIDGIH